MIQNLAELARECGSGISDPSRQQADIAKAVLSHSEGLVHPWFHVGAQGLNLVTTYGRAIMRFPFEGDIFWQNIEWLQEEAVVEEEDAQASFPY